MKIKVVFFVLFAFTLLCITNVKALTLSEIAQNRIIDSSKNHDLDERILNDKGEMTNSDRGLSLAVEIINSISEEYGWSDKLPSLPN